jgi:magnesium transporter
MIKVYGITDGLLTPLDTATIGGPAPFWIDLDNPSKDDEALVEAALGIDIPTREDMQEIEMSSRLYQTDRAQFLTAQVLASRDALASEIGPVTFVVLPQCLVTVHYHSPGSFSHFAKWAATNPIAPRDGTGMLLYLLESVVDRLADVLEAEARKLDALSSAIFAAHRPKGKDDTLQVVLQRIGRAEDMNSKISESLGTLHRLSGFLATSPLLKAGKKPPRSAEAPSISDRALHKTLQLDITSLREVAETQSAKIRFHLDATLGVINMRQSDVVKIFSVVAFVFLPPTLIASVYGMNFAVMPELNWRYGYPMAIGLMILSAVIPAIVFRLKKWL